MPKIKADDSGLPAPQGLVAQFLDEDLVLLVYELPRANPPKALSPCEQDIALRVFAGASNEEIAESRGVSAKTIAHQLEGLYQKLGVRSRVELVLAISERPGL